MLGVLANRTYRHLFLAQVVSLMGTGLATVALGLLAFDLAGDRAGAVLGMALAIKMIAYVGVAPVAAAFAERLPRRTMLVALDLVRAVVALALPFVTEIWQVYLLILLLQSASAGFTPTFQATIPDVLPDERDYTNALSLSPLAYDLESLISPMLAAALLTVISFHSLFAGTVLGFLLSAALVLTVRLPSPKPTARRGILDRTTRGLRLYLATPQLRGLLALNVAVAAAGAMVIVNTVVLVKSGFGLGDPEVALALAAFGAGSMVAALALPRLLQRVPDREAMLAGAGVLGAGMLVGPIANGLASLMPLWFILGLGYSLAQTPTGRLLRRSAHAEDRPALFAAHFALSHACWLVTYPLAGRLGAAAGLDATFVIMAVLASVSLVAATRLWPAVDPEIIPHVHTNLEAGDPHLSAAPRRPRSPCACLHHRRNASGLAAACVPGASRSSCIRGILMWGAARRTEVRVSPRYQKACIRSSVDQGRLGCRAHLSLRDPVGELDELQATINDIEDADVSDDAVDHL
jgi:MFS family permease